MGMSGQLVLMTITPTSTPRMHDTLSLATGMDAIQHDSNFPAILVKRPWFEARIR